MWNVSLGYTLRNKMLKHLEVCVVGLLSGAEAIGECGKQREKSQEGLGTRVLTVAEGDAIMEDGQVRKSPVMWI